MPPFPPPRGGALPPWVWSGWDYTTPNSNPPAFTDAGQLTVKVTGGTPNANFAAFAGHVIASNTYNLKSRGEYYCEASQTWSGASGAAQVGVTTGVPTSPPPILGGAGLGVVYNSDGSASGADTFGRVASYGPTWTAGDIIGMAIDLNNHQAYFSKNGVWIGDPVAETGGLQLLTSAYTPCAYNPLSGGGTGTIKGAFSLANFTHANPVGYSQWR
jgi:hypothetical protein